MPNKGWNPLADIASVLDSIARRLPDLPKLPELPTSQEQLTPPSPPVPKPKLGPQVDVRDPLMTSQMEAEQKRQAEQGLVVFKYE